MVMILKHYKGIRINMNSVKIFTSVIILSTTIASLGSHRIGFDKYHNFEEMTDYLKKITNEFSNISSLYSIGKSVLNRDLWVVKLSTATELLSVPNIKIVGNIHGNEPVGKEIILHLIQYLLDNRLENKVINKLLKTTVIHLLPSMNPDGFEISSPQPCPNDGKPTTGIFTQSRNNAKTFDLNRNFPDIFNPHSKPIQPETKAIMEWLKSVPFIMSLGLHGGTLVANYPYDGSIDSLADKLLTLNKTLQIANIVDLFRAYFKNDSHIQTKIEENVTPDDDVFRFLAKQYAKLHPTMHLGQSCKDGKHFKDGITNGASWYKVTGSMQDYNYVWHGCMEITLEMSCCKYPPASFLESHWNDNLKSLLTWMQQAHRGIKGIVMDRLTSRPITNATLSILGRQNVFNTTQNGEYWKILLPGVYNLFVNAAGYDEKIVRVVVPKQDGRTAADDGPRPVSVNVAMEPSAAAAAAESTVSNGGQYNTYLVSADHGATTERSEAAEATAVTVEKIELLGPRETGPVWDDWPPGRDDYADVDDDHGNGHYDHGDDDDGPADLPPAVRPPMPVSSSSSSSSVAAAAVHRSRSFRRAAETVAPYLAVVAYHAAARLPH